MTVLSFTTNDKFILRIIKHYTTNPSRQWANSYEFVANTPGGSSDLSVAINAFALYEQNLHNTYTVFDRAVMSTWLADSVPYNPAEFLVQDLDITGIRDTTGELEPITTCFSVVRQPTSGRQGHIFYRGVLSQGDTLAPAGITILQDPAAMLTLLDAAVLAGEVGGYFAGEESAPLSLAMINKTGTQTRLVTGLAVGGVVQLPVDHAWFNRTPS